MDARIVKKYLMLFVILWLSQTQLYREELRKNISNSKSIVPLTLYEIAVSSVILFAAFAFFETMITNDVF